MSKSKSRGVVLCAYGKRGYVYSAFNLAYSIKYHSPDLPVTLLHDETIYSELQQWQFQYFDKMQAIPNNVKYRFGKLDPAQIKISVYEFLPYDYNLFVDVDALALSDWNVIFDELIADGGYYYTHIIGEHKLSYGNEIPTMYWAWANDIWRHYNLDNDAILPSTNSSFQFIKKCSESELLFNRIKSNYNNPIPLNQLRYQWGGAQPDELYLNVALAQTGLMPKTKRRYLYMANERFEKTFTDIENEFPILCLFGNSEMVMSIYSDWYDRLLINMLREHGQNHYFKWHHISADKHANTKPKPVNQSTVQYTDNFRIPERSGENVNLFVPFFIDANETRTNELKRCLQNNIANNQIDKIVLLCDTKIDDSIIESGNGKIIVEYTNKRQTFLDAVNSANKHSESPFDISIVCNADIYFDERAIQLMRASNLDKYAFSLSRWDVGSDGAATHYNYEWSNDTWVWSGQLPLDSKQGGELKIDFPFGVPGCDNRFSYELNKRKCVVNPSYHIKTYHLHLTNIRHYNNHDRLPDDGYLAVFADGIEKYLKPKMLFIQPGKTGDIILCAPIAKWFSNNWNVDWKCPIQYASMFKHLPYCMHIENEIGEYDKTLDIAFGLGGAPESYWQDNKHKYNSFVTLKYELAGVPVNEKTNLKYTRNIDNENRLFESITEKFAGKNYVLAHENSDYGSPINVVAENKILFEPIDGYSIFDWRRVIENASEIHCIDSSLCNFVDALPGAATIKKVYYKTNKVPNQWDETLLTNNWIRNDVIG
jgi:hypothetical protein